MDPVFRKAGAEIVAVLCQKPSAVAAWLAVHPLPFPVVADEDRSIAKRWGAYVRLSYDSVHVARPASFLMARDGTVLWAHVSRHQRDPGDLAAALRSL